MDTQEKQQLNRMISETDDYIDNTEGIRRDRNSVHILDGLRKMEQLKKTHAELRESSPEEFAELCRGECAYLFTHFTDIFNKQLKDELNLAIMIRMVRVLEMIEDGKVDQSEGSVIVGKFLKELYVDSALRRADNLDKANASADKANASADKANASATEEEEPPKEKRDISWREYKQMK